MVKKVDTALVKLWGEIIGAVSWLDDRGYSIFEYDRDFIKKGLDVSPIHMSLDDARKGDSKFSFAALNKETFLGLPGLLADSLPDKFGNRIIDAWLARNGRDKSGFSPIERLCYTGKRGMGALEFSPGILFKQDTAVSVEISELVNLVQEVVSQTEVLDVQLNASGLNEFGVNNSEQSNADAVFDIFRVGTSAGGARAKAVIAMDAKGNVKSGQAEAPKGYDYWILKFDGVSDLELGKPNDYGRIEYAYYLMAKAAGINMTECKLLQENGRAHFMTKRFDRVKGKKLHMQSLCGIAHYDFNLAGEYSYEQAFSVMRKLRMSKAEAAEQYRRMLFNIVARNLDDHTKNISFLMDESGQWLLSPAYDITYAHNPAGKWTNQHQMSANGKRDNFSREDLIQIGESISLTRPEVIINEVVTAVDNWHEYAKSADVNKKTLNDISKHHRTSL